MSKSVFGWYASWRALREDPTPHRHTGWIRRHGAPIVQSGVSDGLALLDLKDPHTLVVTGNVAPGAYECVTLLITSPKSLDRGKEFLMSSAPPLHWPIYTEDDIWDVYHVAFATLDRGKVAKQLVLWGPNLRAVLGRVTGQEQRDTWNAVVRLPPATAEDASVSPFAENRPGPTYRLIHVCTAVWGGGGGGGGATSVPGAGSRDLRDWQFYERSLTRIASPLQPDWALHRVRADTVVEAQRRMYALAAHDWCCPRQWFHIEDACVAALVAGGTFKAWRLAPASRRPGSTPTSTSLTVPPADADALARFSTTVDMATAAAEFAHRATAPARLLRPDRFNFPAINGVLLVRGDGGRVEATFFNVTIDAAHTVGRRGERAGGAGPQAAPRLEHPRLRCTSALCGWCPASWRRRRGALVGSPSWRERRWRRGSGRPTRRA